MDLINLRKLCGFDDFLIKFVNLIVEVPVPPKGYCCCCRCWNYFIIAAAAATAFHLCSRCCCSLINLLCNKNLFLMARFCVCVWFFIFSIWVRVLFFIHCLLRISLTLMFIIFFSKHTYLAVFQTFHPLFPVQFRSV